MISQINYNNKLQMKIMKYKIDFFENLNYYFINFFLYNCNMSISY